MWEVYIMIINKRNKKLGRLDREVVVKEREDREKRKLEAEERKKRFIEEAKSEQQKKENNKLPNKVEDRVKDFCLSNGLNIKTLGTIVKRFAEHKMALDKNSYWEQMVLYNPWDSLMSVQGNSFISADKVGMALGFSMSDPKRLVAYVQKALDDTTKGSTILPLIDIIKVMMSDLNLRDLSGIAKLLFNSNGKGFLLLGSNFKRVNDPNKARFLTKSSWYEAEKNWFLLLNNIQNNEIFKINKDIKDFAKSVHVYSLNEKQLKCIEDFDGYNVNILNGIGGVGKTAVMKSVLTALKKSRHTFTCVAPTGIASKMFRDATGEKCVTVHSRCSQSADMIDTDWLVLEEFGMYSVVHMSLLLSKIDIKNPPKILMVGDINQLQPICAGSFFRDTLSLIECGKIKGNIMTLTEIMRAKSDTFIPHLGKMFTGEEKYDPIVERLEYKNVMFHSLDTDITKQVLDMFKRYDLNADDTYVLSPMNKGDFGNTLLNNELDKHLGGEIVHQDRYNSYRKNSIYMHTKNNRELGIYNGEKIRLKSVDFGDWSCEKLHDSESIIYDYEVFKSETQLSYANSFYKVQGLTAKNVVVILSKHHSFMLTREAVYTALSRASEKLIILYDDGMLAIANRKRTIEFRVTFLGEIAKQG